MCLKGLYNTYSIQHTRSIDPQFGLKTLKIKKYPQKLAYQRDYLFQGSPWCTNSIRNVEAKTSQALFGSHSVHKRNIGETTRETCLGKRKLRPQK